ncbi:Lysine-specific demethylase 5C; AltName: Full=Histone demethylase JARID1C; AltName: Full=Jumonji/ARID domain-containing protein 1C; AltName: Full=Protein SmcX [Serendipita indica DSM 11827]|uniref:[histone H3]-trimethyl-L-lysine(4) demethylase n=1 Tax=Serendipita indica (strain DSM 11827) TaxID=1109443 RepID=G4TCL3_SERID|nr:Lysine-specific demethylase 5C; AltName: Full=Histone demethylase JARID1C; AltName: Full=Jumonji/ARID domain-containing protein 1C; AltName: Full=Protein SmcX [Serendipita indica DSM 11827]CCA69056.1 related to regulator Ustilago maydis 1 protein (Rum1) [Serendipita indica DSM 11827]
MSAAAALSDPQGSLKTLRAPQTSPATPAGGPSGPATFTTALSIPVVGTRPILPSTTNSGSTNDAINTHAASGGSGNTGVYPSGPAPARMASTRMVSTTTTTAQRNTHTADESARERDDVPDLGLEPIKVASVLDLNSVRTQAPRPPHSTSQAAATPADAMDAELTKQRLFGLEDCPEYYPTPEEFTDPMAYIRKIAPTAQKYGLCKIVPPENWKMPFVTNTETFRFKTRVQRLNQVEASSRAKISFLEQLYRYHKQHGQMRIIVPTINHATLDLWLLRKEVQKLGGFTTVTAENRWSDIGKTLGYSAIPNVPAALKQTYETLIVPYENFLVHVKNSPALTPNGANNRTPPTAPPDSPTLSRITSMGSRGAPMTIVDHTMERQAKMGSGINGDVNRKARTREEQNAMNEDVQMADARSTEKPRSPTPAPTEAHGDYCEICKASEKPSEMLLCDGCDGGFHIFCLDPRLPTVPKGQWFCHSCLDGSNNEFGFDEGEEHTLPTFQARDMAFRKLWFESHPPSEDSMNAEYDENTIQIGNVKVSEYDVEKEFWRLVQSCEDTVEVEYGADVHSTTHGSAMPTIETHPLDPYSREPWNLNNLPIISDSLLRFIKSDISGMTVPWTYVGMVFSTFCWHNEDHYTYSVNYMHWGATKTWYGVPGSDAEKFEDAIRSEAPELFEAQPDLLYQLVTLMRPDRLKEAGVKVVACNQRPGEFVITFPKAYHAGFNHGFNFNEAINFALPEWLPLNLESVLKYQQYHKAPVFSHDELLCTIAQHSTSIKTAIWLKPFLTDMLWRETKLRNRVRENYPGIFEVVDAVDAQEEEQHQCVVCKAFCHLSRMGCECTSSVVCHSHASFLCECDVSKRVLQLRYSDKTLEDMVNEVIDRAAQPSNWRLKLAELLTESPRPLFRSLKFLAAEGDKINYPLPELTNLKLCIERGDIWLAAAANMLRQKKESRRKKRTKKDASPPIPEDGDGREKTLEDAEALLAEVGLLGFDAPEISVLEAVIAQAKDFKQRAGAVLEKVRENMDWTDVALRSEIQAECQELLRIGWSVNLSLDETDEINLLVRKLEVLAQIDALQEDFLTLSEVRLHLEHARLCGLTDEHPMLQVLREKLVFGEEWEKKANAIFESKIKNLKDMDEFTDLPASHPMDASVLSKIMSYRSKAKELEKSAKALMWPEGNKRTKIADAQRLIARAEKDFSIPAVSELHRVLEFAIDLETRCEAVLNKKHPQSESESVFDAVRKWRAYADEHLTSKFHLPQYEMLKSQLDAHDKWYNRLPFPKPRRDHVEHLYKDVAECTKTEEDAAPNEEFCTCICTLPVRPPPPGTVSDAVQCDHCQARFHPQCAGGSCPFCDHHHWNGSLHRGRYYHSFDVLACVRPVPDLTRNYSRLWKQIEFIATRIARLQNVITHFLAFAAQSGNQRPEIIPQVRHYMRKLFKIQVAISPRPNVSYGLDLAGLHRILASQKRTKRRRRGKMVFKQENEKEAPDGTQCFCHGTPPNTFGPEVAPTIKCTHCLKLFHSWCVEFWGPTQPEDWYCPMCATKRGKTYRSIEVRVRTPDDIEAGENANYGVYVDVEKTLKQNRDLVKVQMGQPNKRIIVLDLIQWFPAEENPPLPVVPMIGMYPQSQLPTRPILPQVTYTTSPPDAEPPFSSNQPVPIAAGTTPSGQPQQQQQQQSAQQLTPVDEQSAQLGKKRKPSMELLPGGDEKRRKAESSSMAIDAETSAAKPTVATGSNGA